MKMLVFDSKLFKGKNIVFNVMVIKKSFSVLFLGLFLMSFVVAGDVIFKDGELNMNFNNISDVDIITIETLIGTSGSNDVIALNDGADGISNKGGYILGGTTNVLFGYIDSLYNGASVRLRDNEVLLKANNGFLVSGFLKMTDTLISTDNNMIFLGGTGAFFEDDGGVILGTGYDAILKFDSVNTVIEMNSGKFLIGDTGDLDIEFQNFEANGNGIIDGNLNMTGGEISLFDPAFNYTHDGNEGLSGNFTNGNCYTSYSGGIAYATNCSSI